MQGINRGRLDRQATSYLYSWTFGQIHKAYNNWNMLFRKEGTTLLFKDYLDKMVEINITPDDLGNGIDDFHLCRVNDEGGYRKDNCSFKVKRENLFEQRPQDVEAATLKKYGAKRTRELHVIAGKARWGL